MLLASALRRASLFALLASVAICVTAPNRSTSDAMAIKAQSVSVTKREAPIQPIPYSHKKHLAQGLRCQDCHPNPEPGDRITLPAASKCMTCHSSVANDKPVIQKLAAFAKSGAPIPWVRVYSVPSWVYWNHRSHLDAQMTCEMCHGRVDELDVMEKITNVTTMQGCVDCHKKNDAGIGCRYCHADK